MKKIITMLLFSIVAFAQDDSKKLNYTNVIKLDSVTKSEVLFVSARSWLAENYNSSKDLIQYEDKTTGTIIGKGTIPYNSKVFVYSNATKGLITYTITIQLKDGRYKYEVTNFTHSGNPNNNPMAGPVSFGLITTDEECPYKISTKGWRNKVWLDLKTQIDNYIQPIVNSLNNYMKTASVKKDEKW